MTGKHLFAFTFYAFSPCAFGWNQSALHADDVTVVQMNSQARYGVFEEAYLQQQGEHRSSDYDYYADYAGQGAGASINAVGSASLNIKPAKTRKACPHYQQMSCLLDAFEKACQPDWKPAKLLSDNARESIWVCCCPEPYQACHESEADKRCLALMEKHIRPFSTIRKEDAFEFQTEKDDEIRRAIHSVRAGLREQGGKSCLALASPNPSTGCGFQTVPPVHRSLTRADQFCEMLTWQWEELGDGNPEEFERNGCPFVQEDGAGDGEARKGGKITKDGQLFDVQKFGV